MSVIIYLAIIAILVLLIINQLQYTKKGGEYYDYGSYNFHPLAPVEPTGRRPPPTPVGNLYN